MEWVKISRNTNYSINRRGEIRNDATGRIKSAYVNPANGYLTVDLYKNNKSQKVTVHRLLAEAFIPNPDGLPQINHKDENPRNNRADNLEWCTREYNINYGSRTEKTSHKVAQYTLDGKLVNTFPSIREASRYMGKKYPANIAFAVTNNRQAFGYLWRRIG